MEYPSHVLSRAVEQIASLPGIGQKTALRMALHLLRRNSEDILELARAIEALASDIHYCPICHNICDEGLCDVCSDKSRDSETICVVEDIRDVIAIENTGLYRGVYHVLGGRISPMEGIGPNDIEIDSLIERVKKGGVKEIIFALSSTIEGDTTSYYIYRTLPKGSDINVTSIARGVSIGEEIQYADHITLARSIRNRIPYENTL